MIFHIFVPADAPAWVLTFVSHAVEAVVAYIRSVGVEAIYGIFPNLKGEDDEQG